MTQPKTNRIPPGIWAVIIFIAIGGLIALYFGTKEKKPYEIPKETIDQLRACAKLITVMPIDTCEYIITPFIGETIGLTLKHKENCKNH